MDLETVDGTICPDEYDRRRGIAEIAGRRSTVCRRNADGFGCCVAARRHRSRLDRANTCIRFGDIACRRDRLNGSRDRHDIRFACSVACVGIDRCISRVDIRNRRNRCCVGFAFAAGRIGIERCIRPIGIPGRRNRYCVGFAFAAGRVDIDRCIDCVGSAG